MSEAIELVFKMEEQGCFPDSVTYNLIVRGFLQNNDFPNASYYCDEMVSKGFEADVKTSSLFISLLPQGNKDLLQKFIK